MRIQTYSNFDIEIDAVGESRRIRVRVQNSPEGETEFIESLWPFGEGEEEALVREIRGSLAARRGISVKDQQIQNFGSKLFNAIFCDEIEQLYRSSYRTLKSTEGLRIRLRLPRQASAHSTPWEFMFDEKRGEFLVVKERTPVVRYPTVSLRVQPLKVEPPLRVLVAMSAPEDQPRIEAAREWEVLRKALAPAISEKRIALRRVKGRCTFNNLRDALLEDETHVFHFIGHGVPGSLFLENDSGDAVEMNVVQLTAAFPGSALPRLIVLNACAGAVQEGDAVFSGIAQSFLRAGVPAAVGMQALITDRAAINLARTFYTELAAGTAVDTALTEARLRLQGSGNQIEWGTPVLYMRAPDGHLFETRLRNTAPEEKNVSDLGVSGSEPARVTEPPPEPSHASRPIPFVDSITNATIAGKTVQTNQLLGEDWTQSGTDQATKPTKFGVIGAQVAPDSIAPPRSRDRASESATASNEEEPARARLGKDFARHRPAVIATAIAIFLGLVLSTAWYFIKGSSDPDAAVAAQIDRMIEDAKQRNEELRRQLNAK